MGCEVFALSICFQFQTYVLMYDIDMVTYYFLRQAIVSGKGDQLLRYAYRLIETGVQKVYEAQGRGENVTQGITLINLKGFSLIQHACARCKDLIPLFLIHLQIQHSSIKCSSICTRIVQGIPLYINIVLAYENHYPGMAHKIVMINSKAVGFHES